MIVSKEFSRATTRALSTLKTGDVLVGCNVYFSGVSFTAVIDESIKNSKKTPAVILAHVFQDKEYNRTGLTFVGKVEGVKSGVFESVCFALNSIDLRAQVGKHPRIGVVDHIVFHPLIGSIADAALVARSLGNEIASTKNVPIFLYGAASNTGKPLDEIRRSLGYFKRSTTSIWEGAEQILKYSGKIQPDFGPCDIPPKYGCIALGAAPWITNFNVLLDSRNLQLGKTIAAAVSERGGGLPKVQAMALLHGGGKVEIACNLLNISVTSTNDVLSLVTKLSGREGVGVLNGYSPGITPEIALSKWKESQHIGK